MQAGQKGEQMLEASREKCWQKGAVGRGPRQCNGDQQAEERGKQLG